MSNAFALIDLVSQCHAVEQALVGSNDEQKIAWLSQRGSLAPIPIDRRRHPDAKQVFRFRSAVGIEAAFFLEQGRFIFLGDHTTFRPSY